MIWDVLLKLSVYISGTPMLDGVCKGIDMLGLIEELKEKFVLEALEKTAGNKKKAASLLGLTNYQTLTNWMEKLGLK